MKIHQVFLELTAHSTLPNASSQSLPSNTSMPYARRPSISNIPRPLLLTLGRHIYHICILPISPAIKAVMQQWCQCMHTCGCSGRLRRRESPAQCPWSRLDSCTGHTRNWCAICRRKTFLSAAERQQLYSIDPESDNRPGTVAQRKSIPLHDAPNIVAQQTHPSRQVCQQRHFMPDMKQPMSW